MRSKLRQMDRLVQLAELREGMAQRRVAAAAALVAERTAELQARQAETRELIRSQAERRETLRNPVLGSSQLRGSLAAVLSTFEADRDREAQASARCDAAEQSCRNAEAAQTVARQELICAGGQTEKRRRMRAPLRDALITAADRRDEAEIEENRKFRRKARLGEEQ